MPEADGVGDSKGQSGAVVSPGRTLLEGIVVAVAHGFVEVQTGQSSLLCTIRGRLLHPPRPATPEAGMGRAERQSERSRRARRSGADDSTVADLRGGAQRIAPGDRVRVLPLGGETGVVEELLPRRSALERSAGEAGGAQVMLANLDHAVLVFAVRDPLPHLGMLDRYLALCEHAGVDITICLNKVDLGVLPAVEAAADHYRALGYMVLRTSAVTGEHLVELQARLEGRISLLTGPSGVGKSSLINRLLPGVDLRTRAVSEATGKGRHTTTGARLLPLGGRGWLADSAGIRELALWNVSPEDLPSCFVELRSVSGTCLYEGCSHAENEEGCAIRAALAYGRISAERFASFERLLSEARSVLT